MDEPEAPIAADDQIDPDLGYELPPGQHPLEIAARRGIGPLSPMGRNIWHGDGIPCVSCGQLVRRQEDRCDQCGQDLSEKMIEKMRAHAGPWYVLEHLRPFPGVTLERIIRQIRRGLLTETSIVRGPSTDYQWRFAVETPGLCRYFGRCWNCHEEVTPADTYCQACLSHLSFEKPRLQAALDAQASARAKPYLPPSRVEPVPPKDGVGAGPVAAQPETEAVPTKLEPHSADRTGTGPPAPVSQIAPQPNRAAGDELARLADALHGAGTPRREATWEAPPRIGPFRATWVVTALLVVVIAVLLWITGVRRQPQSSPPQTAPDALRTPDPVQD